LINLYYFRGYSIRSGNKDPGGALPEYVSNEIIVHLKPGTIQMPAGRYKANKSEITVNPKTTLAELMNSQRTEKVRKVFRSLTPADTIRTLKTGKRVKTEWIFFRLLA